MIDKKDLQEVFHLLHEIQDAVEDSDQTLFYKKMSNAIHLIGKHVKGSGFHEDDPEWKEVEELLPLWQGRRRRRKSLSDKGLRSPLS